MTSALSWWLYTTYFPSEKASKNTKKKASVKDLLSKRRNRNSITVADRKPPVFGLTMVESTEASTEGDDPGKTCRVCLKEGEIPIYGNGAEISESVRLFGGIKIDEGDEFPKHLCGACHSMLQSAVLFRKKAKESEKMLRENSKFKIHLNSVNDKSKPDSDYKQIYMKIEKVTPCQEPDLDVSFDESIESTFQTEYKQSSIKSEYNSLSNSIEYKDAPKLCRICYKYIQAELYEQHSQSHKSPLICEICGKMYKNLEQHVKLHSSDLPFHCEVCPYRGNTESNFKTHMRTHTGDKPYSCEECGYRCTTKSNLNRHKLSHKGKHFKCNKCVKFFSLKLHLERHMKSAHFGRKKLFECEECGNKFGFRKYLLRHERNVHKRKKVRKGRRPLYLQNENESARKLTYKEG